MLRLINNEALLKKENYNFNRLLIKSMQLTIGLVKYEINIAQHQVLFHYCAAVIGVTKFYSSKKFILNFN